MIELILIAVISLLAQLILPWWSLAVVAFVICYFRSPGSGRAFLAGFVGIALVWFLYAVVIHTRTDGVFTGRMSELLFKTNTSVLPLLVTALVGGLVGGLAGLSGYFVRQAFGNQSENQTASRSRA
ncbi:hypothetical protein [Spirosoma humi]